LIWIAGITIFVIGAEKARINRRLPNSTPELSSNIAILSAAIMFIAPFIIIFAFLHGDLNFIIYGYLRYVPYGLTIFIVSSLVVLVLFIIAITGPGNKLKDGNFYKLAVNYLVSQVLILILVILISLLGVLAKAVPAFVNWLGRTSEGHHAFFVIVTMFTGLILFWLRKNRRVIYGAIEVIISLIGLAAYPYAPPPSGGQALSTANAAWFIGILSLVYVLVRGLDNIDVGRKARVALREMDPYTTSPASLVRE
jgi:hypothetical protein